MEVRPDGRDPAHRSLCRGSADHRASSEIHPARGLPHRRPARGGVPPGAGHVRPGGSQEVLHHNQVPGGAGAGGEELEL